SEPMQRARQKIIQLGGADQVNSFTRFYLAILGQIPYDRTPAVPPQMMFLPKWFPINIYAMSSWSRTIFVPLAIVSALQPVRAIPAERGLRELFIAPPEKWKPVQGPGQSQSLWARTLRMFFTTGDRFLWFCRRIHFTPWRSSAIEQAKQWTLKRFTRSDGPGAIYPPIVWSWIALKALGYADDSKEIVQCRRELESLIIEDESNDTARLQPCKSPVWDTCLTLKSLLLSGMTRNHPVVQKGLNWLLARQTVSQGDWSETVKVSPGGWAFEYNNEYYPDCDDTAMALMVLGGDFADASRLATAHTDFDSPSNLNEEDKERTETTFAAIDRGFRWLSAMQNNDGSWGAFDRNNNHRLLCSVPFADHNAMIDPGTPDLTGRVMESLGRHGYKQDMGHSAVEQVIDYIRSEQLPDGSWFGRWGVNYIYGTWQALTGLSAMGVSPLSEPVRAGANWLIIHQQADGGWGESPDSYKDPMLRGQGTSTASQTAWAVMGLIAAGKANHPAVRRGIDFLLSHQNENGRWDEKEFTGTGFPQVFYLKYHYYPVYFPLMALSLYSSALRRGNVDSETGKKEEMSHEPTSQSPIILSLNDRPETEKTERTILSLQEYNNLHADCPEISAFSCWGIRPLQYEEVVRPRLAMTLVMDEADLRPQESNRFASAGRVSGSMPAVATAEAGPVCFQFPSQAGQGVETEASLKDSGSRAASPGFSLHLFEPEEDESKLRLFI
ncbi:MAG: squalene--hopene cyclase, partial [Planctomycetia bacterium]|nr:squalene--hopene cyclase [Planctomycetia bacterium]